MYQTASRPLCVSKHIRTWTKDSAKAGTENPQSQQDAWYTFTIYNRFQWSYPIIYVCVPRACNTTQRRLNFSAKDVKTDNDNSQTKVVKWAQNLLPSMHDHMTSKGRWNFQTTECQKKIFFILSSRDVTITTADKLGITHDFRKS